MAIPTILLPDGTTKGVDEIEKTPHYEHWRKDFELVKEMGIEYLRYGPPYYKAHTGPGSYDWSFSDDTFNRLRELNINPIEISVGKKYSGENFSSGKTRSWRVICKNNLDETGGLKMTKKSLPGKAFSLNIGTKF